MQNKANFYSSKNFINFHNSQNMIIAMKAYQPIQCSINLNFQDFNKIIKTKYKQFLYQSFNLNQ